ncbi:MAG TPA: 1-hydroxycarotenoid 3,4-desaturase CrtD [Sediminibacterium sp.]|nr:1-hydroxycarotenoid 3,4-desaturase CrtD [Sediminibacterium sp.]
MQEHKRAVVIGAGVAGIASAIRLAVQGWEVTVFEKNNYPGGKLSHFYLGSFSFDAGPSLFTQPHLIEELFQLAGEPITPYFRYRLLPVSCHYFYEDGTRLKAWHDQDLFARELSEKLGEKPAALSNYLRKAANMYRYLGNAFLEHSLHKPATLAKIQWRKALQHLQRKQLFDSLHHWNAAHFSNPKTVQLFNRYATYNGSDPYQAPGMLGMIPHLEHNEGAFYPDGGMISITQALFKLAQKKGVRFEMDSPVERIIGDGNQVRGVVVNGKNRMAELVISNMDVYFTYHRLLRDERKAQKISRQERSSSALIFYWGISKTFPELDLHNIFFSADYAAEFRHIFRLKQLYPDPTVYINITSKCEPGLHAPAGKENWFVMVNVPAHRGDFPKEMIAACRTAILAKLDRLLGEPVAPLIEAEQVLTPAGIETVTASYMGALYGTSSNARLAAFLRHPNFSRQYKGLYFVGGSVHPGGGIPLCLRSAAIMSQMVSRDYPAEQP